MHLNKVVIIGRVGARGVKLTYDERSTPTCAFTLEVDEVGPAGKVYTSYLPVEIVGKYAEAAAERLEAAYERDALPHRRAGLPVWRRATHPGPSEPGEH
jgi:hypothetical protein